MIDQATTDALNKALDLAKQGVVAAFEKVRELAPYVWQMARRQTLLDGYECALGAVLFLGLFVLGCFTWTWAVRKGDESDGASYCVPVISLGVGILGFLIATIYAVDLIGNPDYWTMMKILEIAKH